MRIHELVENWVQHPSDAHGGRDVRVCLPLQKAAQVAALAEMFTGGDEEAMLQQLIAAAIEEVEAGFPYVPGETVAEDEFGDPVRADAGQTPRFLALTEKHYARLQGGQACGPGNGGRAAC